MLDREDLEQILTSAMSNLGLLCLYMSVLMTLGFNEFNPMLTFVSDLTEYLSGRISLALRTLSS